MTVSAIDVHIQRSLHNQLARPRLQFQTYVPYCLSESVLGIDIICVTQGRRQDFAKGGADARHEMPTSLRSEVSGLQGDLGDL